MSYNLQINSNEQATITVPKKWVEHNDWESGQELEWILVERGRLELREASEE
jgi:bifunctional DNA-binding transcriptional regulator/antitoxin component of YhaV-PrlF toxin-antitoxin module